jgi:hypothetical protein
VGRGGEILKLLASEDVDGDEMDLGVAVLASLGGGHVDNLARAVLDHNKPVLPQSRALHGVGGRGTGITTALLVLERVLPGVMKLASSQESDSVPRQINQAGGARGRTE